MSENTSVMAQALRPSADQVARENVARDLETYVKAMAPGKPIDSQSGGEMQRLLWRCIKTCLRYDGPIFTVCWSMVLETVAANLKLPDGRPGAFGGANPFRFPESTPLSPEELMTFQRIIHLMRETAVPSTRLLKVRHIDLNLVVRGLPDASGDKLKAFYTDY